MNYVVLGAGAWGTAMAIHLARNGQGVTLVPRRMEQALELASVRENRDYLPGYALEANVQIAGELGPALMEAEVVLLACPMKGLREACKRMAAVCEGAWRLRAVLTLCKGLEPQSHELPGEVVEAVLPGLAHGALSGPSFAAEVAKGKPTALTLALPGEEALAQRLQEELSSACLRVYRCADVRGVELGGCLKNIYAIGAGIAEGLGLGDNAKAAYLTRALREMVDLGKALGADAQTFFGLSGFGDLVATCNGQLSRNRGYGEAIGRGESPEALLENRRTVVEGYGATRSFYVLARQKGLEAPILSELHAVLCEGKDARVAIGALMSRGLKEEGF